MIEKESYHKSNPPLAEALLNWGLVLSDIELVEFKDPTEKEYGEKEPPHVIKDISSIEEIKINSEMRRKNAEEVKDARLTEAMSEEIARKREVEKEEVKKTEMEDKEAHRKPSNVIYVVNKPQPGQVKGDWAVRSHGKIYSHHRTQENAIKQARKIAKQKNATVLIQGIDGKFRDGFKPKN